MNAPMDELDSLLLDWECGSLDEAGMQRLREILKTDAQARAHFVHMQMMVAAMRQEADAHLSVGDNQPAVSQPVSPSPRRPSSRPAGRSLRPSSRYGWVIGTAALLLGGWMLLSQWMERGGGPSGLVEVENTPRRDASQEATAQGVALVTRLVDVDWDVGEPAVEVGEALRPGRFAIRSGYAQVEFFCGATVVVEGPAELELVSATLAKVRSGRLRAHVPPAARGFALEADGLKVKDLGTEFGLAVSAEGANVQVFDGSVELAPALDAKRVLTSGEALIRTSTGEFVDTQATPETFVDIADLEARSRAQRSARYQRWRAFFADLRRDPRVIAYYAFDRQGDWERRLACDKEPPDAELDGAIVGAREVAGRFYGKRALEFKQPGDRVRVQIPGEYESLTLACWVRIDSLDRWYNSLFLTDGYDKGEPHWQILDSGRMYFSVRPAERGEPGPRDYKALSPAFWKPSMIGKWIHLAVTCDVHSRRIVHYLNGEVLSRHVVPKAQMPPVIRIGTASIGNWALPTQPDARFAIRNLNGSMDEFVILAAALDSTEIKEMYERGKP